MNFAKIAIYEIQSWLTLLIFSLPGRSGSLFRSLWLKKMLKTCGARVRCGRLSHFEGVRNISLGIGVQFDG